MKTVNLRRYSEPDTLREISPRTLVALMDEHREFLARKGVVLPPVGEERELDYRSLATVFLSPDDIPHELVEKFHMVKQMSGPGTMDKILDTVRARQMEFTFPADSSPEDVAAHLLLTNRPLFQEIYAQKAVARYRSFVYYVARRKRAGFQPPTNLTALEKTLNSWYEAHQRGRSARVFWREHDHEFWFYVRHAQPIKRDGCYGYSNYSRPRYARHLLKAGGLVTFNGQRLRSTLGGAGVAVSSKTKHPRAAMDFAQFTASPEVQKGICFQGGGQPGHRAAWLDDAVNAASSNFFRDTLQTLDEALLRPQFPGYIDFQDAGTPVAHDCIAGKTKSADAARELNRLYRAALNQKHN